MGGATGCQGNQLIGPWIYLVFDIQVDVASLRASQVQRAQMVLLFGVQWDNRAVSLFYTQTDGTRKAFLRNGNFGPELFTFLTPRGIGDVLRNEERYGFSEHR